MKKIFWLLLFIPYLAFGQTKYSTDTLVVRYIKAKTMGKVYMRDSLILKDGSKLDILKSNWNTAYNTYHIHLNKSLLDAIKPQDTTRWAQAGSSSMTSKQIIDSISKRQSLPNTKKIPFTSINTWVRPYQLTGNTIILVDTIGSFAGAVTHAQYLGQTGYTLSHERKFSPLDTSNSNRTIQTTTGMLYTFLYGSFGEGIYQRIKFNWIDSSSAPGAPIQLSAPGSFQAIAASQTQINTSWTVPSPNGRYFKLDSCSTSGGTFVTLSSTIDKRATSYNVTGLHNNHTTYFRISTLGNGSDTLTSGYATANATTSALTVLGTPTLSTPTVVDSVQINLTWSQVTNNSGYKVQISRNSGSTYTDFATTSTGTNSKSCTGLHQDSTYYFKVKALGDNVTYSDGAYCAGQSGTTWGGFVMINTAATNTTGDTIYLTFRDKNNAARAMQSSPSATGLSLLHRAIKSITRHSTIISQYDVAIYTAYPTDTTITCSYTPGTILANDFGVLKSFSGQSVTNNVTITYDSDAQAYFTATSTTNTTFKNAWNIFIVAAKNNSGGNAYYSNFQALYFFCHNDQAMNKFNAVNPANTDAAFRISFYGTWAITDSGITGGTTSIYGDLHYNPSLNASQDNCSLGVYLGTDVTEYCYDMVAGVSNNTFGIGTHTSSSNTSLGFLNQTSNTGFQGNNSAVTSSKGWSMITRSNSTQMTAYSEYASGSNITNYSVTSSITSATPCNTNVIIARYAYGEYYAPQTYSTKQFRMAWIGTGFTQGQSLKFKTDINTLMTTLGLKE